MKNTLRSRLISVFIYLLIVLFVVLVRSPFSSSNMNSYSNRYDYITNDDKLNNTFHSLNNDSFKMRLSNLTMNNLNYIDVGIKTYNENITENNFPFDIALTINNNNSPVIYGSDGNIDSAYVIIMESKWLRIILPDKITEEIKKTTNDVLITFTCKSSDPVFELIQTSSLDTFNKLSINDLPVNQTLLVRGVYEGDNRLHIALWIALFVMGLIFCLFQNGTSLRSFFLIAVLFGTLILIVTPFPNEAEGNELVNIYYYTNHSLLEAPKEAVWLPSKLLSRVSYNTLTTSELSSDYASYNAAFCAGIPLFQWLLSLPLKLTMNWSLSNVYTLMVLRGFCFLICLMLNAVAVGVSKKNKRVIFFVSLIPFILTLTSSLSSVGLLFSFSNLLMALAFRGYEDSQDASCYSMKWFRMAAIYILLFIISVQNIIFGLLAMIVLFYIPHRAFGKVSKSVFLGVCAFIYSLSVALGVLYFIHNKEYFSLFTSPIYDMLQSTGSNPKAGVVVLAENTASIVTNVINKYVFGNEFAVLFALFMGASILCIAYEVPHSKAEDADPESESVSMLEAEVPETKDPVISDSTELNPVSDQVITEPFAEGKSIINSDIGSTVQDAAHAKGTEESMVYDTLNSDIGSSVQDAANTIGSEKSMVYDAIYREPDFLEETAVNTISVPAILETAVVNESDLNLADGSVQDAEGAEEKDERLSPEQNVHDSVASEVTDVNTDSVPALQDPGEVPAEGEDSITEDTEVTVLTDDIPSACAEDSMPDNSDHKKRVPGVGLIVLSAIIMVIYAALCSCIKNTAIYSLGGLFGLFLAVLFSWMSYRRSEEESGHTGRLLAFLMMICSFIAVSAHL